MLNASPGGPAEWRRASGIRLTSDRDLPRLPQGQLVADAGPVLHLVKRLRPADDADLVREARDAQEGHLHCDIVDGIGLAGLDAAATDIEVPAREVVRAGVVQVADYSSRRGEGSHIDVLGVVGVEDHRALLGDRHAIH
eukprot:5898975-Pyramimonas_sp.AAC.1